MALALRFAEEAEYSSRAGGLLEKEEQALEAIVPSVAIFRWSKAVCSRVGGKPIDVAELYVATTGSAQSFLQEITSSWHVVGTIIMNDQPIQPLRLDASISECLILSEHEADDAAFGTRMAVILAHEISQSSIWPWTKALEAHVNAQTIFCFDAQLSHMFDNENAMAEYPFVRLLATSSASKNAFSGLTWLETPRFATGITAALLTRGELRQRQVFAFICIRDSNTLSSECVRAFVPLLSSLPLCMESPAFASTNEDEEFNALYT